LSLSHSERNVGGADGHQLEQLDPALLALVGSRKGGAAERGASLALPTPRKG
jgi:hypothetical protein